MQHARELWSRSVAQFLQLGRPQLKHAYPMARTMTGGQELVSESLTVFVIPSTFSAKFKSADMGAGFPLSRRQKESDDGLSGFAVTSPLHRTRVAALNRGVAEHKFQVRRRYPVPQKFLECCILFSERHSGSSSGWWEMNLNRHRSADSRSVAQ